MPITFDAADHPDRTSGVGVLPLVVSPVIHRSEEHTSELQSHYSISYAVFCLKKKFF